MTVELVESAQPRRTPRGFAMGHKQIDLPAIILPARHLFGAARPRLAQSADLRGYVDAIRNQLNTEKCVGMSLARVIHVQAQVQKFGAPNPGAIPYPSEMGIYDLAREEEGTGALIDQGSSPGMAIQALSEDIGVPLERDWPADDAKINDPLPVDVLTRALAMKVTSAYAILSESTQRADDCVQALSANHAISLAISVGDSYENVSDETSVVAVPANGKVYGGHDITLVGFRIVNGRRQFLNAGSWGTGWGFGGYCWLDESVVTATGSLAASDFIVIQVAPDFSPSAAHRLALNPPPQES